MEFISSVKTRYRAIKVRSWLRPRLSPPIPEPIGTRGGEVGTPDTDCNEEALEKGFVDTQFPINVNSGRILLAALVIFTPGQSMARRYSGTGSSYTFRQREPNLFVIGHDIVACLSICLALYHIVRPRTRVFCVLVAYLFIETLLTGVQPIAISCERMIRVFERRDDLKGGSFLLVRNMDCENQSYISIFFRILVLFVSSHLWPAKIMVHLNWVFVIVMYILGYSIMKKVYQSPLDVILNIVLLCVTQCRVLITANHREEDQRTRYRSEKLWLQDKLKLFRFLELMLPEHVILPMLMEPDQVIAMPVERASILFISILDFDHLAAKSTPKDLLAFLNRNFRAWDRICELNDVTKIETVGEEYVAAVGVVPRDRDMDIERGHECILGPLVNAASSILRLQTPQLQLQMGIHTGPVVAAVIGQKAPRFRLFGDTINTSARMMQKGVRGKCQFGEQTKSHLPAWAIARLRGDVEMKGKGNVTTYLLELSRSSSPTSSPRNSSPKSASSQTNRLFLQARSRSGFSLTGVDQIQGSSNWPLLEDASDKSDRVNPQMSSLRRTILMADARSINTAGRKNRAVVVKEWPFSTYGATISHMTASPSKNEIELEDLQTMGASVTMMKLQSDQFRRESANESVAHFEELLRRFGKKDLGAASYFRKLHTCGLRNRFFDLEREELFQRWYYDEEFCKEMSATFSKMTKMLFTITLCELVIFFGVFSIHREPHILRYRWGYEAHHRLPVYLSCRIVSISISYFWWKAANGSGSITKLSYSYKVIPHFVVWCVVFITLLLAISYDAVTRIYSDEDTFFPQMNATAVEAVWSSGRRSGITCLIYAVVFYEFMMWEAKLLLKTTVPLIIPAILFWRVSELKMWKTALVLPWPNDTWSRMIMAADGQYPHSNFSLYLPNTGVLCLLMIPTLRWLSAYTFEVAVRLRFKAIYSNEIAQERIDYILRTLMPPMVVQEVRGLGPFDTPPSHTYKRATIAQSDLVGFTKMASSCTPKEVVALVSELFGVFDALTEKLHIYKVETIGDAYIAGQAEHPLTERNSPTSVVHFALEMVAATQRWARARALSVSSRVGVHTGECVGGIVGTNMQRYHLFGEFMSALEILESTSVQGRVQLSVACARALQLEAEHDGAPTQVPSFTERDLPHLTTSKGEVHSFDKVGGSTYLVDVDTEVDEQLN